MAEKVYTEAERIERANQLAGYLKLTSAHFHVSHDSGAGSVLLGARFNLFREMDRDLGAIAQRLKYALGGWYNGEALDARDHNPYDAPTSEAEAKK